MALVMRPGEVTVLVHTENPDEVADLDTMAMLVEEGNRRGGSVDEFKRRLQAQRERAERPARDVAGPGGGPGTNDRPLDVTHG